MPELPDLENHAKNLRPLLLNREISRVDVHDVIKANATQAAFSAKLLGVEIGEIARSGKELLFRMKNKACFSVHYMLKGKTVLCEGEALLAVSAKIVSMCFADGGAVAFCDPQKKLKVTLNPRPSKVPDAFSKEFTPEYLKFMAFRNGTMNAKGFLIDQHIVRGIGNAYADEILYAANISPASFMSRIPPEALGALHKAILDVLNDGIEKIDRLNPGIIAGEERSFLKVHNPDRQVTEKGEPILVKTIASKTTYFAEGQRLY